jgi:hypothetical protein
VNRIRLTLKQRDRWVLHFRWLAAGGTGFLALILTGVVMCLCVSFRIATTTTVPTPEMSPVEFAEVTERTRSYHLRVFGLELARDDNLDGHDTRGEIGRLRVLCDWLPAIAGLIPGVIVAGVMNAFLRIAIRRRINEVEGGTS